MVMNFDEIINKYDLKIKGVIHIGAHYGQEYNEYVKHDIENLIFFEPLKNNFAVLLNNIKPTDKIKLHNIALGNMKGEIEMFVESDNQGMSSSILEPQMHLIQYPGIRFNGKELVKINKLDDIKYNKDDYNFINIDVQGYELEVFKGAVNSLKHIDYIMTEINREFLYKDGALELELDSFLMNFRFIRTETYWAGETWGDALYIKNDKKQFI
jgi:FkbM family methyltransferase